MTLKKYIEFKLRNSHKLNNKQKKKLLLDIYKEMEQKGYSSKKISKAIQKVTIEKIRRLENHE